MLAIGQIIEVEVQMTAVFGIFCRYAEQDILVLIPEISWIASFGMCHQFAEPGDRFLVKIKHVDQRTGKVAASIKELHPNPWETGQLAPGAEHQARVVRYVDKADRCDDSPGYLLELLPGAYLMLCADGLSLKKNQQCRAKVYESDAIRHVVKVIVGESSR
jgi:predicted RNA-binding protein with RPS1 domain